MIIFGGKKYWKCDLFPNKNYLPFIKKIIAAFKKLEFPDELIDYIKNIEDFSKPFAVKIGEEPIQVDVFNAITGVSYADAEKKSIFMF